MTRIRKHRIFEGRFLAEIDITIDDDGSPWGPSVNTEDVKKTDRIRLALRRGDITAAANEAKIFELHPVAAE